MAGGSPILTSNIRRSLKLTLDTVWGDEMKKGVEWEGCGFRVSNTTDSYIDDQEYAGIGPMPSKAEGAMIAVDSIQEGYSQRYTMATYAVRMIVSREALADKKYDKAIDTAGNLARSAKLTQEIGAANVFINAFNSAVVGADAVSMCSTAHKLPKGGTYANKFATATSFSETAVEQMSINMGKLPDSNGYVVNGYRLKKLVLPLDYKFRAMRILKSANQNDTANNAINALKSENIEFATNIYFTSSSNWWGTSDASNGLRFVWREKPKFEDHNSEDTYTAIFAGYERFAVGWTDPRGVYGSDI